MLDWLRKKFGVGNEPGHGLVVEIRRSGKAPVGWRFPGDAQALFEVLRAGMTPFSLDQGRRAQASWPGTLFEPTGPSLGADALIEIDPDSETVIHLGNDTFWWSAGALRSEQPTGRFDDTPLDRQYDALLERGVNPKLVDLCFGIQPSWFGPFREAPAVKTRPSLNEGDLLHLGYFGGGAHWVVAPDGSLYFSDDMAQGSREDWPARSELDVWAQFFATTLWNELEEECIGEPVSEELAGPDGKVDVDALRTRFEALDCPGLLAWLDRLVSRAREDEIFYFE